VTRTLRVKETCILAGHHELAFAAMTGRMRLNDPDKAEIVYMQRGDDDNLLFIMRSSSTPVSWIGSVIAAMSNIWYSYRTCKSEPKFHVILKYKRKRKHETQNNNRQLPHNLLTSNDQSFHLRQTSKRLGLSKRDLYNGLASFDAHGVPQLVVVHDGLQQGSSNGCVTTHDASIQPVRSRCNDVEGE
ncbi:hypothetical protein Tco_1149376, partial [Tanacetum coccineum]